MTSPEIVGTKKANFEISDKERQEARTKLSLPSDLRIEKKVANPIYDVYYVPGYDKYS